MCVFVVSSHFQTVSLTAKENVQGNDQCQDCVASLLCPISLCFFALLPEGHDNMMLLMPGASCR